jgi:hypothetical protein
MTLNTTDSKVAYAGDGSTTVFAVPFKFLADGDVEALLRDDTTGAESGWTENTQYALTGAGNDSGGTLTVTTSPTDYTPQSGETLVIRRNAAEVQGAAFPAGGAFPSATIETALDRLTMLVQQHSEAITRTLSVPATDPSDSVGILPSSVARLSRYLAFDANGAPIAAAVPEGGNVVSAFMATVLDDIDSAAARATLGVDVITAGQLGSGSVTASKLAPSALGICLINGTLISSVGAGTCTIAVKTLAGTDPSPADPVRVVFDAGNGTYGVRDVTAALAVTLSSGSTLGTTSGAPFRIWVVAFDDAGTLRLGIINCRNSSGGLYALGRYPTESATAEGGSANSAQVIYSPVAVASKPYAVLGWLDWESGLSTAGTWSVNADRGCLFGSGVALPGDAVWTYKGGIGAVQSGTSVVPYDDTIPQASEGDAWAYLSSFTPVSPCNLFEVEARIFASHSIAGTRITLSLFNYGGSATDALASAVRYGVSANVISGPLSLYFRGPRASDATGFITRVGGSVAGTTTINGESGARKLGGSMASFFIIREIMG